MKRSIAFAALLVCLVADAARAEEPDGWGRTGSVLVQGGFSLHNTSGGSNSLLQLTAAPGVQVFVGGPIVLGGAVLISYRSSGSLSATLIGLQPSVGVNLDLGPTVALVPQINFTYGHFSGGGQSASSGALGGYVPIMVHPVPHFFFGFGPNVQTDLFTDDPAKTTTIGVQTVLGGYF